MAAHCPRAYSAEGSAPGLPSPQSVPLAPAAVVAAVAAVAVVERVVGAVMAAAAPVAAPQSVLLDEEQSPPRWRAPHWGAQMLPLLLQSLKRAAWFQKAATGAGSCVCPPPPREIRSCLSPDCCATAALLLRSLPWGCCPAASVGRGHAAPAPPAWLAAAGLEQVTDAAAQ
eukprot:692897-Pelagomonas_calceolata.AAC.4